MAWVRNGWELRVGRTRRERVNSWNRIFHNWEMEFLCSFRANPGYCVIPQLLRHQLPFYHSFNLCLPSNGHYPPIAIGLSVFVGWRRLGHLPQCGSLLIDRVALGTFYGAQFGVLIVGIGRKGRDCKRSAIKHGRR